MPKPMVPERCDFCSNHNTNGHAICETCHQKIRNRKCVNVKCHNDTRGPAYCDNCFIIIDSRKCLCCDQIKIGGNRSYCGSCLHRMIYGG